MNTDRPGRLSFTGESADLGSRNYTLAFWTVCCGDVEWYHRVQDARVEYPIMLLRISLLIASVLLPSVLVLAMACYTAQHPLDLAFIASFYNTGQPKTDLTNRLILLGPGLIGFMMCSALMLVEHKKQLHNSRWWLALVWLVTCAPVSVLLIVGVACAS